eukprot:gb/GECG01013498.1/.p1 GENE.gb/GECG01013498.1/~~gb/GECG01013498.1/.p1  ORF type:complete len:157 (+),score=33.47 gb/GECG01013498.1/:1-471(+)
MSSSAAAAGSASGGNSSGNEPPKDQNEVIQQYRQMRQEEQKLSEKIAEIQAEDREHQQVLETLKDLEGERRCFRMVGDVLVEQTVKDVVPELEGNKTSMKDLITKLHEQLNKKTEEREKFQVRAYPLRRLNPESRLVVSWATATIQHSSSAARYSS